MTANRAALRRRLWLGRVDLVMELYHAVVDAVGGQAAETLASVADCYRKSVQPMWRRFVPWL